MKVIGRPRLSYGLATIILFVVLFPLAARLADPLATIPFDPAIYARFMVIYKDRIELVPLSRKAEFSPRSPGAEYSFIVPPEREAWVKEKLDHYPTPTSAASWRMTVSSMASGKQRIDLELLGDGVEGIIYEAGDSVINPERSRIDGPAFAFVVLGIDLLGGALILGAFWTVRNFH